MFPVFEIKHRFELTWDDLAYLECPAFARTHTFDAVAGRSDPWGAQVLNIDEFKCNHALNCGADSYNPAVEQRLSFLFSTGNYFSVARNQIPFAANFKWRLLDDHPDGGEWYIWHYQYGDHVKHKLEAYAKHLGEKRRRMLAEAAEDSASAAVLTPVVRRVVEKRSPEILEPKITHQPKPAQSLDECEQRLKLARKRLITNGYQSKYTDAQIQALAQKGELDDRFVVRLIETKYAGEKGYLGQMKVGEMKYWSTTFNQMENADTDPQTLCALIGVDHIPGRSYTLVIVDTQAKGAGQSVTIVPTHNNLGAFAKREIKGVNPEAVDGVMTPAYNQEYAEHMVAFKKDGGCIDKETDIQSYVDSYFSSKESKTQFKTRIKIHERLGANEHYTGNGTTKNLIEDCSNKCGVMETFTYDKSPQTLGQLESSGNVKRIAMTPI